MDNVKEIIGLEEEELRKEIFISASTIYRFCRKLDVKGYDELRLILAKEYIRCEKNSEVDYDFPFSKTDSAEDISKNLLSIYTESLELTQNSLDEKELEKAITILKRAKNIIFFTSNINTQVAEKFDAQLKEIGKSVTISSSPYRWKLEIVNMTRNDALIIISYTGVSSGQFADILPEVKKKGIPVILIGSALNKVLMPYATSKLLICDKEHPSNKLYGFSSNISSEYVLDILYCGLYQENYDENFSNHEYVYKK